LVDDVDISMTFKDDQREQRRGGFYWMEGKPYVSVTNVLKVIDKPALRYWFGREVYRAMVVDPTMGEQEALSAPYKTSDKAKSRGTTVHSIVEAWKASGIVIEEVPEEFRPYAEAFYKFVKDNHIEIIEHEKTVISKEHGYAGTTDLIVKKNGSGTWVLDVKTGKDIYMEAHLQLSAYRHALEENGQKIDNCGVILLQDNGKYKFEESEDYFDAFLATKKLWEFVNKDLCKSIGYGN
jgi:hypothetical protein